MAPTLHHRLDNMRGSRLLDRALRPFSRVEPGEGLVAFLMLACVFAILTSYYVMKTAREGLILADGSFGLRGEEVKTYATGAMAILLVAVVPAYSALANRMQRLRLIDVSYAIVIGSLVVFFVLGRSGAPIGIAFFIWLGLVNVFLIAQFWSYANDIYTEEQGKRLFAIIAIGGAAGAIVGPKIATLADTYALMVIAAAILAGCVVLFHVIERIQVRRDPSDEIAAAPITGAGGFTLVLRDRYLLLIAAMLIVLNLVNTTGEFILSTTAADHAERVATTVEERREVIKAFYGDFFFWVNTVGFVVQAFLVSRIIERLGVRRALFGLPLVALFAYGAIGAIGGVALIRIAKIAENGTNYSLQNTVRQALFLPTDRAVKYKAKAAIDTFFVRAGDLLAAIVVGFGIHELALGVRGLAIMNLGLVLVWFAISFGIARHHRRLSPEEPVRPAPIAPKPQTTGAPA